MLNSEESWLSNNSIAKIERFAETYEINSLAYQLQLL